MTVDRCALGVDPGTARMGYAVVGQSKAELTLLIAGVLETPSDLAMPRRLRDLYDGLLRVIDEYQPSELAIEDLFFNRNVRSAVAVGQARGVVLLAAAQRDLEVYNYTPLQVKQTITGFGRARKDQIQEMIRVLLQLTIVPQPDDAADAAALAVCHLNHAAGSAAFQSMLPPGDRCPRLR
ncbi:MAG TPA: crossover junction endodeoxyribonuclease RuvC [Chloroflexota bacterium]|nr:crossover junction endodeoxyribonuclease RuvC [Chloroflexota bacterium]